MFNPHINFEMFTVTCNEQNVKILVLSHPFRDLGITHRVHLWLHGKCIVKFLLAIIQLFSLAVTAAALLSKSVKIGVF